MNVRRENLKQQCEWDTEESIEKRKDEKEKNEERIRKVSKSQQR